MLERDLGRLERHVEDQLDREARTYQVCEARAERKAALVEADVAELRERLGATAGRSKDKEETATATIAALRAELAIGTHDRVKAKNELVEALREARRHGTNEERARAALDKAEAVPGRLTAETRVGP